MAEEQLRIELDYTYTYDQFTVFFYGDRVFAGKKDYSIGQCCVDVMNLDESILDEIDRRVRLFIPAARKLPTEKTDSAAALAQERLNAVWELIFALPVYRDLKMDKACCFHTFRRLMADREKWAQVRDPSSEGYAIYQGMMAGLACFADSIRTFRLQVTEMTRTYFEPLKRRNYCTYAEVYAGAYAAYFTDMAAARELFFPEQEFSQSFPAQLCFVPMAHPTKAGKVLLTEKAELRYLSHFLYTDFYRGLMAGNAPCRCHNCGRYFLLTSKYNICYCNNIAPGETVRTCRRVGAHRKETQGKANHSPEQEGYGRLTIG